MGTVRLDTMASDLQESVTSNLASTSVNKGRAPWRHNCICKTNFRMCRGSLAFYRCWKTTKGQSYRILECKKRGTRPMWAWMPTLLCPLITGRLEGDLFVSRLFLVHVDHRESQRVWEMYSFDNICLFAKYEPWKKNPRKFSKNILLYQWRVRQQNAGKWKKLKRQV